MSAAERSPLERVTLAAAELRHGLKLAMEMDDQAGLRTAIRRRLGEVAAGLPPADQAWFLTFMQHLADGLRGAGPAAAAMEPMLKRLSDSSPEIAAALTAPPRPYKLTRHGGAVIGFAPRIMASFLLREAARDWRPTAPTGTHIAQLLGGMGASLTAEQAPALLEAAQSAWRDGTWNDAWDEGIRRLNSVFEKSRMPWGLNQVALLAAFLAEDRIEGSVWLGPLKAEMHAALMEGGDWEALLRHVAAGDGGSKPAKNFSKMAAEKWAGIGAAPFRARIMGWLATHPLDPNLPDPDADALKQLIWMVGTTGEAAATPLGQFAQRCFVKVPQIGARSVKLGNAALAALGLVEPPAAGAAELDRLRQRVKYPSALKQIEAALAVAAKRAGLSAEDLTEMAVPDFDLGPDGTARVAEPEGGAVLRLLDGRTVSLEWSDATGKTLAAPPAALKKAHPALIKDWTERKRALDAMLAGQISRLEGFYERDRAWPAAAWTQRYANHALLGPLSRRLIWRVTRADGSTTAICPTQDQLLDVEGRDTKLAAGDRVSLWHPIEAPVEEVLAWRAAILSRGIVQPFKQAHREIYRLTDAERATQTYSNRFAGHILRQHQMLALAKSRFWTGTLQGAHFDGANDPTKNYPAHGLSVSFGAEIIEGDEGDISPHGISLRVASGAVTFRTITPPDSRATAMAALLEQMRASQAGEPIRRAAPIGPVNLADVPAKLFSEAMRDVDLLVSVASLGADPAWTDGGPGGRFGAYWRDYAEAELAESGQARHAVLAAILPRLNIGPLCTLEGRHLVVRGRLKTYRIHLGSGSIFFLPEGQYLCIVPARGDPAPEIALPFEGDAMLSTILSKALLLARDDLIKDQSILTQLRIFPRNDAP